MSHQAVARASRELASPLKQAVYRSPAISRQGVLERLFTSVFDNLVYTQIWEDPEVDLRALAIRPGDHLVTIASGGCNVLSYLIADPGRITAVDLNPAHLALTRLKIAAARHLPDYGDFRSFFAEACSADNQNLYHGHLVKHLDSATRDYWSGRDLFRSRRIALFSRNFYRFGMLGYFILAAHIVARLYGVDPRRIMTAATLADQRRFFDDHLAPLFERPLVRWLTSSPVSLYGLGIPPAQYKELADGRHMADVLRERLAKLACDHLLQDNYFARQAFTRTYGPPKADMRLPPYLEAANWDAIRGRASRVETSNRSVTESLADAPEGSVDRVVLLDAQDWMSPAQMNALWAALSRAAAPGAHVIFRTAARSSPLERCVDPAILAPWCYRSEESTRFSAEDRSAIYGGFHLYVRAQ